MSNAKELAIAYFRQQADIDAPAFIFSDSFQLHCLQKSENQFKSKNLRALIPSESPSKGPRGKTSAAKPFLAEKLLRQKPSTALPPPVLPSIKRSGLAALFHEAKTCQNCILGKTRKNLVFGAGSATAPLMIIGEAPTEEDDEKGMPGSADAGELLTKMLAAISIDKTNTFLTTIVKCRPPDNRHPALDELNACLTLLSRQIEIISPKFLLLLGDVPVSALLGAAGGVGELRLKNGELFYKSIPVYCTYSPSDILTESGYKRPAWEDLKKLQTALKGAGIYDGKAK